MTALLYQTDSYLKEFDATLNGIDAEACAVSLDRTCFYPGGGGQPCDVGRLTIRDKTYPIERLQKRGEDLLHFLGRDESGYPRSGFDDSLLSVGLAVHGQINWERRYQLMRTHTAMHILCGVIWRDYGASVTGGDMEPLKGRMDFEFETLHGELVRVIEAAVNREIAAGREVRIKILPRQHAFEIPDLIRTKINLLPEGISQVRTVEIVGLDLQADGGTHVHNTSEVGLVHVVDYKSKGAINKRIYIEIT